MASSGRLTLRELEARRQRAAEGIERYEAAKGRWQDEQQRWKLGGHEDAGYRRVVEETEKELAAAAELIREGLPRTALVASMCPF